jgi:NAD-dependent dihydropyrimidine dehydrogenase PreA subunit
MSDAGGTKITIDPQTCTGCGLCLLSCPVDVIRMDPDLNKAVVAYGNDCHVCYLCEDDCPEKSINLSHDISNSRRFSTYDQFGLKI